MIFLVKNTFCDSIIGRFKTTSYYSVCKESVFNCLLNFWWLFLLYSKISYKTFCFPRKFFCTPPYAFHYFRLEVNFWIHWDTRNSRRVETFARECLSKHRRKYTYRAIVEEWFYSIYSVWQFRRKLTLEKVLNFNRYIYIVLFAYEGTEKKHKGIK